MYRARAARAGPEPGSPGRFGILSTGQLRDLLQDEPKLDRIVRLSRKFQGLQLEREACLASNYALAKENLALRPRLEMGRTALAIKYQELREVAESCADKLQRLEESMHRWSPHCALGWLQAELEEAEQEAEEQMEQLLLGEQSLEAFLPAFQRGRALAHLRRTQAEKLQELLRRRERSGQPAPTAAAEPPKSFPAAAVLPTGAARGPPAAPRSLPPLDSRPVPPLKGSPGCPLGPAPLLSPRPSQPEPPHRWGHPGDGPAPVQELDSWGPGKLPASLKGPCLGALPPLPLHWARTTPWLTGVFSIMSSAYLSPSAGVHHLGAGGSGPSGGDRDTMAMGLLLPAPLRLQTLGRGRPGVSDLQG